MMRRVPARFARLAVILVASVVLSGSPVLAASVSPIATTCSPLTAKPTVQVLGSPIALSMSVTPIPYQGYVYFRYVVGTGTVGLGAIPIDTGTGAAGLSTTALPLGTWNVQADYSDDASVYGSCSTGNTHVTIVDELTSTSISVDLTAAAPGQDVTWTATVNPVPTGGSVIFHLANASVADDQVPVAVDTSTGIATLTRNDLALGGNTMWAGFSLLPSFGPSQSSTVSTRVASPTPSPTPRPTPTRTPTPTAKPTPTPTPTPSDSPTPTPTLEPSASDLPPSPGDSAGPASPSPTPTPAAVPAASEGTSGGTDAGLPVSFSAGPTALVVATGLLLLLLLLVVLLARLLRRGNAPVRALAAVVGGMAVIAVVAAALGSSGAPGPGTASSLCTAADGLFRLRDEDASRLSSLVLDGGAPHLPPQTDGMALAQAIETRATAAGAGIAGLRYPAAPGLVRDLQLATSAYTAGANELIRLYGAGAAGSPDELAEFTETLADATRDLDGAAADLARLRAAGGISCGASSAG